MEEFTVPTITASHLGPGADVTRCTRFKMFHFCLASPQNIFPKCPFVTKWMCHLRVISFGLPFQGRFPTTPCFLNQNASKGHRKQLCPYWCIWATFVSHLFFNFFLLGDIVLLSDICQLASCWHRGSIWLISWFHRFGSNQYCVWIVQKIKSEFSHYWIIWATLHIRSGWFG